MLFRDVTGAGGRGSINCAHLPGGSSPRADYYYYTHQQRCRDEEKYIETKRIIISMISN